MSEKRKYEIRALFGEMIMLAFPEHRDTRPSSSVLWFCSGFLISSQGPGIVYTVLSL